jgi:hypothetical protein
MFSKKFINTKKEKYLSFDLDVIYGPRGRIKPRAIGFQLFDIDIWMIKGVDVRAQMQDNVNTGNHLENVHLDQSQEIVCR